MKIGIVCYPTYGGSGVVATELGIALAGKGHQVHFISYSQPVRLDTFVENVYYHEVQVSNYPLFDYAPYELVLTSKIVDICIHEKLDILHVHYAIPHATAAYLARQILSSQGTKVPFVTTLHGTDITLVGKDSSFVPAVTFAINQSDVVTAVSESLKRDTLQHFAVEREIKVIPNFICLANYKKNGDEVMRQLPTLPEERILVHISNFRKVKRIQDVIKVFAKIRAQIPAHLLLIGDGPERGVLESLCRELMICSSVSFLGKMKHPERILQTADLFLLTSEFESFGLSALEAMACGVPVVSTDSGGIPEVNRAGFSGLLSPVGDITKMYENAMKILGDDKQLDRYKTQARQRAKAFDVHEILPKYEDVYQEAFNNKGRI